jgi:hypothetical protein
VKYDRFNRQNINQIISVFCKDGTNTINAYYHEIRRKISNHCLAREKSAFNEFELNKTNFPAYYRNDGGRRFTASSGFQSMCQL